MKNKKIELIAFLIIFLLFLMQNKIYLLINKSNTSFDTSKINLKINEELEKENTELKKLLEIKEKNENYIFSEIKFRDIYDFFEEVTIYKGSKEKIQKNAAVISNNALIGTIKKVKNDESIVRLLTNKETNISVKVKEAYGLLKSDGKNIYVTNLTNYDVVNIDDEIYTSGIGNLPGNILIGKVKDIKLDSLGIEKILEVSLATDITNLNYCYVVGAK